MYSPAKMLAKGKHICYRSEIFIPFWAGDPESFIRMCGTWKSERVPSPVLRAPASEATSGGRRPFWGAAGTGEGLSQAAGVGGVCRSRVKKPESRREARGQPEGSREGPLVAFPQTCFVWGQHGDLALRVCP